MRIKDWQSVGGELASAGVFYYHRDVSSVAATGLTNSLLLVPLVVTGYSIGSNAAPAPGLAWLYRRVM